MLRGRGGSRDSSSGVHRCGTRAVASSLKARAASSWVPWNTLQPTENLRVRQVQLLEGPSPNVGGQLLELLIELGWQRVARLGPDPLVKAPEVIDCSPARAGSA